MKKDILEQIKDLEEEISLIECGDEAYSEKRSEWRKLKAQLVDK